MKQRHDRTVRVAGLIQEILAPLLQQHRQSYTAPLVTITSVTISRDLAHATIYVSVLSDDKKVIDKMVEWLNSESKVFRLSLAQHIRLRIVPTLRFVFDESTLIGFRINNLLHNV